MIRLWPSCPGLAPPGLDLSRCSLRSVEGGLEDVREVFSGRCSRSTSSISSSLLRRSRSLRPIRAGNQPSTCPARGGGQLRITRGYMQIFDYKYPVILLSEAALRRG